MIKIVKNRKQIHPIRNSMRCPKYLLKVTTKDGQTYYSKIGIGEIWFYIRKRSKENSNSKGTRVQQTLFFLREIYKTYYGEKYSELRSEDGSRQREISGTRLSLFFFFFSRNLQLLLWRR